MNKYFQALNRGWDVDEDSGFKFKHINPYEYDMIYFPYIQGFYKIIKNKKFKMSFEPPWFIAPVKLSESLLNDAKKWEKAHLILLREINPDTLWEDLYMIADKSSTPNHLKSQILSASLRPNFIKRMKPETQKHFKDIFIGLED